MADQRSTAFRDADWSASDELIVATEHAGFVRDLIGSRILGAFSSQRLGLTRFRIAAVAAAADLTAAVSETPRASQIRDALRGYADAFAVPSAETADERTDRIAEVAGSLRALAAARHGGWMPTLGRNRVISYPGDGTVGTTSETSFGLGATGVQGSETSFGSGGRGQLRATSETSFGGGGAPRSLVGVRRWSPPAPRAVWSGHRVRVGVLDTGVWPHPWLGGAWLARPSDVLPDDVGLGPIAGHGTFVAGLILSQAPNALLDVRKVLDGSGQGTAWEAAEAIAELGQGAVSVLNLSFACYTSDAQPPLVLARAIDRVNSDVVVVAAAGNHGAVSAQSDRRAADAPLPAWPAALDDVIAVGALERDGRTADFSPDRPWVDVAARGVELRSTYLPRAVLCGYQIQFGGGWAEWSGTSFSAALVSGAVAAGIDPGRRSGPSVVENLLTEAPVQTVTGVATGAGSPLRLDLRTTGWARGSKGLRR